MSPRVILNASSMPKRNLSVYIAVLLVWCVYAYMSFSTPTNEANNAYNLTPLVITLLRLSVALPYLLAWLAGCYGGLALLTAAGSAADKEDSIAYKRLAVGVFILIGGIIVTSVVGGLRTRLAAAGVSTTQITILTNYLYVLAPLVGFSFVYSGSGYLRRGSSASDLPRAWTALSTLALALFSVMYVWLVFTNPTRQVSTVPNQPATYFLSDPVILLTIILPFLATCLLALLSVLRIAGYYRGVTGFVYKRSSLHFINGLLLVIFGSLLLQALQSLGSTRLSGLGLGPLLALIYLFLAAQTFGFVFISLGAKKLSAIERVMSKYAPKEDGESA